jgi:hypothetical protein
MRCERRLRDARTPRMRAAFVTTALRRSLGFAGRRRREEESDATSDRAPSRSPPSTLRHRRRRHRGMEIHTTSDAPPAKTHQRMRTPRRATLPTNRGATRHRSLVRGPDDAFASFGPKRIAPPGALLERAGALRDETLRLGTSTPFLPVEGAARSGADRGCRSTGTSRPWARSFGCLGGLPRLRHPSTAASTTTSTTDCFRG